MCPAFNNDENEVIILHAIGSTLLRVIPLKTNFYRIFYFKGRQKIIFIF